MVWVSEGYTYLQLGPRGLWESVKLSEWRYLRCGWVENAIQTEKWSGVEKCSPLVPQNPLSQMIALLGMFNLDLTQNGLINIVTLVLYHNVDKMQNQ